MVDNFSRDSVTGCNGRDILASVSESAEAQAADAIRIAADDLGAQNAEQNLLTAYARLAEPKSTLPHERLVLQLRQVYQFLLEIERRSFLESADDGRNVERFVTLLFDATQGRFTSEEWAELLQKALPLWLSQRHISEEEVTNAHVLNILIAAARALWKIRGYQVV